ncbi:MAG TPA: hypothetical protein VD993_11025 [Chitinophagaceae bacterium]|nr:hypothetical protein [Chitinophagaceae bacterium]
MNTRKLIQNLQGIIKRVLLATTLALCLGSAIAQNMVVVNNTPGIVADYKTLQGAVDSVTDGTLILLQPGFDTYGNITIKKRVSIIGAGYFLNHNPDPTRQATPSASVVSSLVFDTASNGSYVTGLSITGLNNPGNRVQFSNTSNVTVSRCLIGPSGTLFGGYKSNLITVKQSYIQIAGTGHATILFTREATDFQFLNNVFDNEGYGFQLPGEYFTNYNASVLFQNNVMFNLFNPIYYPSACTFINNIIFQGTGFGTVNAAAASNNVGNATYSAAGPNITNAVKADVFVLNSDPNIASLDGRFQLKTGSVAIGYGQGGVDCGVFGGLANQRYELSGIAEFVPNIFYLNVPAVGTANGGLPVHIKVRANR